MYRVSEILSPSERLCAMQVGAIRKLASCGIGPKMFVLMEKKAQQAGNSYLGIDKLFLLSAMLGIPIGTMTYALGNALKPNVRKNKKLKASLDQFNDIVDQYKRQIGSYDAENSSSDKASYGGI